MVYLDNQPYTLKMQEMLHWRHPPKGILITDPLIVKTWSVLYSVKKKLLYFSLQKSEFPIVAYALSLELLLSLLLQDQVSFSLLIKNCHSMISVHRIRIFSSVHWTLWANCNSYIKKKNSVLPFLFALCFAPYPSSRS